MNIDFCARAVPIAALAAALFTVFPASAHHSPAAFDTKTTITVTGVVTKYEWFNPHVHVTLEQTTNEGMKLEWKVECQPPSMMSRMGWNRETLRIGDTLAITGSPAKNPSSKGLLAGSIKRADSTLMDAAALAKQFAVASDAPKFVAKGLAGTWLTEPKMQLIMQFGFPQASQLTPEGARMRESFDAATSPAVQCISGAAPLTMVIPDLKQISVGEGAITIRSEFDGAQRTIHLSSTAQGAIPSHQGHSVGRWEGKTLVVDSTLFAYHGAGNGMSVPSGAKKHVVERFTPSADGTSITYSFETHDPEFVKAPRTGEVTWKFRPDLKFAPPPCDLDNARRFTRP